MSGFPYLSKGRHNFFKIIFLQILTFFKVPWCRNLSWELNVWCYEYCAWWCSASNGKHKRCMSRSNLKRVSSESAICLDGRYSSLIRFQWSQPFLEGKIGLHFLFPGTHTATQVSVNVMLQLAYILGRQLSPKVL